MTSMDSNEGLPNLSDGNQACTHGKTYWPFVWNILSILGRNHMCHVQHWIPYNGCINPYNQIVAVHKCGQFTQVMTESCASEVAAPTPLSRLRGGGTRCKQGGGWTENGKHTANCNVLAVCQGHVTLRIPVDKPRRAVIPCGVKSQWHTEPAMLSELLRKLQILEGCTTRPGSSTKASKRALANKYKQASSASI